MRGLNPIQKPIRFWKPYRFALPLVFLLTLSASAQFVQPMGYRDYSFWERVNIGKKGAAVTHPSAYLEMGFDSLSLKGFLPPRLTTTARNAIASPARGLYIHNISTGLPNVYNGSAWVELGSTAAANLLTSYNGRVGDIIPVLADYQAFYPLKTFTITINGITNSLAGNSNFVIPVGNSVDTVAIYDLLSQKVNISDTASMLFPYLRKADTMTLSNRIDANNYTFSTGLFKSGNVVTALTNMALWNANAIHGKLVSEVLPINGQALVYDSVLGKWKATTLSGGGATPTLQQVLTTGNLTSLDIGRTNNTYMAIGDLAQTYGGSNILVGGSQNNFIIQTQGEESKSFGDGDFLFEYGKIKIGHADGGTGVPSYITQLDFRTGILGNYTYTFPNGSGRLALASEINGAVPTLQQVLTAGNETTLPYSLMSALGGSQYARISASGGAGAFYAYYPTSGESQQMTYNSITYNNGAGLTGSLSYGATTLTGNRLYYLPNATGTIALQEWVTAQGYLNSFTETDPLAVKLTGAQSAAGEKTWSDIARFNATLYMGVTNVGSIASGNGQGFVQHKADGKLYWKSTVMKIAEQNFLASFRPLIFPVLGCVK